LDFSIVDKFIVKDKDKASIFNILLPVEKSALFTKVDPTPYTILSCISKAADVPKESKNPNSLGNLR
jgi:hypothetical protein